MQQICLHCWNNIYNMKVEVFRKYFPITYIQSCKLHSNKNDRVYSSFVHYIDSNKESNTLMHKQRQPH